MNIGYSTDKPETTLQDVANMFGCDLHGYTVLLSGDVTGMTPKQLAALIESYMRAAMIKKGLDVSVWVINQDKERLMDFISKQAEKFKVTLLKVASFKELKNYEPDAVLPIGDLNERLIAWAQSKDIEIWGEQ